MQHDGRAAAKRVAYGVKLRLNHFSMSRTWRESGTELAAWWSLWTLADCYLISFTPFSELAVLMFVLITVHGPGVYAHVSKRCSKHSKHVEIACNRI
jgi:hypothetical protein